jgi:large subunit ribosomal protein L4
MKHKFSKHKLDIKRPIVDFDNNTVGEIFLSGQVFGEKLRSDILNRVVEWQRSKRRAGTHHTKGISDISGTTKKMYKQKGTGRARHGSARAGQFRKGAVLFGPKFRSHEYSIQKKVKDLALKVAISLKCKESKLIILNDLNLDSPKTKNLVSKLANLGIGSGLFVATNYESSTPDSLDAPGTLSVNFFRAYKNIKHVDALPVKGINVYDILKHDYLVFTKDGVSELEKRLTNSKESNA